MKKGKQFLKRALTIFMSLAIVFTSVNVPSMTVMAAPEASEEVEAPVTFEDVTEETSAPAAPQGLVAHLWTTDDANKGKIYVAWNSTNLGDGGTPATYTVYVGETEVATVDYAAVPNSNTFIENTYEAGTIITIGLTATNEIGTSSMSTVDLPLPATEGEETEETLAPAAPQGFVAQYWTTDDANKGKIYVAWNNLLGDGGTPATYTIYVDDTEVATVDYPTTSTFIDNTYEAGTHVVAITATNSVGTSDKTTANLELSEEQAGSGEDKSTMAPATPLGLVVEYYAGESDEDVNKGKIKVMWNNIDIGSAGTPTSYVVYVGDTEKATVEASATPEAYLENTFEANKEYTVGLTAKNANGESEKATATFTLTEEQAGAAPAPTTSADVVISEQTSQAFVGNDVVLTYVADAEGFIFANYTVLVNGSAVDFGKISLDTENKEITLDKSLFGEAGVYDITFVQKDCTFTPVYQRVYAAGDTDDWNLVWNDEFNGTSLDSSKWDHQIGRGTEYTDTGWGNQEEQYYTDSTENSYVEDGKLTIKAIKDDELGYTSARIRTTNVETGKKGSTYNDSWGLYNNAYGKIEAKMKLPAGKGIWPAFWMLPENSKYGTWAASGEIDIMEAKGRLPEEIVGTIHYGGVWPNNTSTGKAYHFEDSTFEEYHIYGIEWDPDEIRWYVDGELYSTLNNWYAEAGAEGNFPYPAPFDEEFHILFNMAIGGTFDSAVSSDQVEVGEDGVCMDIDYVRWYQREGGYADWEIELPETEKDESEEAKALLALADEEGNFIKDADFAAMDTTPKTTDGSWEIARGNWIALLIPGNGNGNATWSKTTVNDENLLKVQVKEVGSKVYSSQMIQYFPVVEGYSYEISYKAYTDSVDTKSDINLKIGGDGDNDWSTYSGNYTDALTTTPTTFTHKFTMSGATDPTARFEFNLATSAGTVYITDVAVKILENGISEDEGQDDAKEPLADGNHIYNGEFNVGSDSLLYWHWGTNDETGVVKVTTEGSDYVANVTEATSLWQNGMNLLQNDTYKVTADVNSTAAQTVIVYLTSASGEVYGSYGVDLNAGDNDLVAEITMPADKTDAEGVVKFKFTSAATIDSVKMVRTTDNNLDWGSVSFWPLYNGDFFNGTDGWNIWSQGGGWQSNTVGEDGKLAWTVIMPTDGNYWDIGAESNPMTLTKGIKYKVKFDYEVPAEAGTKTIGFKFTDMTDPIETELTGSGTYTSDALLANGNAALALYFGAHATEEVTIKLDNIEVYVDPDSYTIPSGYAKPVSLKQLGNSEVNDPVVLAYTEDATWEAAEKTYFLNGNEITDSEAVTIDTANNKITIKGSYFTEGGEYTFAAKAEGFTKTQETKLTVLASANLLLNGDFSDGLNSWSHYEHNGCGSMEVTEDGVLQVNHNWNEGEAWHYQLYQEGLEYEAGTYVVEFDAWADVERPIIVQLQHGNDPAIAGTEQKPILTTEKKHYRVFMNDLAADSAVKLNFMMGNVTAGSYTTPNDGENPYKMYLDNVQFRPVTEDDYSDVPGVIESAGPSTVKEAVTINYAQAYKAWKEAAKTVYVNDKKVAAKYVKEATNEAGDVTGLTIDGSLFKNAGAYTIYIVAKDFEATNTISKNVYGTDGNRIFNGTMDSEDYWTVYDEDAAGLSAGSIENGKYTLDYKAGYFKADWNCWVTWSSQLKQENISVENGKTYKLRFKANTDMLNGRDIIVETSFGQQTVSLGTETNTYEIEIAANATKDDMYVAFLLGPVGENLQTATPNEGVAHTMTIDSVQMFDADVAPAMPGEKPANGGLWIKTIADQTYTGSAIKPAIEVYEGDTLLGKKDYTVSYKNNKNAGTATVTVKGKGNYSGSDTTTFEILKKDIAAEDITAADVSAVISAKNGKVKNPKVVIKYGKVTLKAATAKKANDYTLTWPEITDVSGNNIPGSYEITVTGNGNYTGTTTINYDVLKSDILLMSKAKISIAKDSPVKKIDYANPSEKPTYTVKIGSKTLTEGQDYEVIYPKDEEGNEKLVVGKNVVTFRSLTADIYGSKTFNVTVTGAKINAKDITVTTASGNSFAYTGKPVEYGKDGIAPIVVTKSTVSGNETITTPLVEGTDYKLEYSKDHTNAGKKTVSVVGINGYTGKKTVKYTITKVDMSVSANNVTLELASDSAVYNKKGATVPVVVKYNGEVVDAKFYKVAYKNNKKVSTDESLATVTVTGKTNFTKSLKAEYKVIASGAEHITFTAEDAVIPKSVDKLKTKLTIKETATGKALAAKKDYVKKVEYLIADADAEGGYRSVSGNDLVYNTEVTARITLMGNYGDGETTTKTATFRLYETKASAFKIANIDPQTYAGGAELRPEPVVTIKVKDPETGKKVDKVLVKDQDYTVSYDKNTAVGKGKVIVTGINQYGGTKSATFKITKKPMDFVGVMSLLKDLFD